MPSLSRNARKLLTQVKGKPHATQEDYVDELPTPPATNSTRSSASRPALEETEEDINRDPESSEDEEDVQPQVDGSVEFKKPYRLLNERRSVPAPTFKKPISSSPASVASKRSNGSDGLSSDTEDAIFASQDSKRRRMSYGGNIHAPQTTMFKPRPQMYGKAAKVRTPKKESGVSFKPAKKQKGEDNTPPVFKAAKGVDMFKFTGGNAEPQFKTPRPSGATSNSRSPSLSPLSSAPSSPEVEEIQDLNLPDAQPYCPITECSICRASVDLFLKEQFEDEFTPGKHMSYKWQQRFCRYHKQHEARLLWQERRYPDIDWDGLEMRMASFQPHLEKVISGTTPSYYRDDLAERLKGRTKTTLQAVNSEDVKGGAQVGYYGPRGEKAMQVNTFSGLCFFWTNMKQDRSHHRSSLRQTPQTSGQRRLGRRLGDFWRCFWLHQYCSGTRTRYATCARRFESPSC